MVGVGWGDGYVQFFGDFGEFLENGMLVARVPVHYDDLRQGKSTRFGPLPTHRRRMEGGEVAASPGAGVAAVGKRDLYEEDLGRRRMCQEGQEAAAGVAGEGDGRRTSSDNKAHRRCAVGHRQGQNFQCPRTLRARPGAMVRSRYFGCSGVGRTVKLGYKRPSMRRVDMASRVSVNP